MENYFSFMLQEGKIKCKGKFKVYQGSGGGIYILMANSAILMSIEQVHKLPVDIYLLEDFDQDNYNKFYNLFKNS